MVESAAVVHRLMSAVGYGQRLLRFRSDRLGILNVAMPVGRLRWLKITTERCKDLDIVDTGGPCRTVVDPLTLYARLGWR